MLNAAQRIIKIEKEYGRKTIGPDKVYYMVKKSIQRKKAISVIRLGDVMAKLLARQNIQSLNDVSAFLGIQLPLSSNFRKQLIWAVHTSDIVGLSHFEQSIKHIKAHMSRSEWSPRLVTDSFINDQLYEKGYLHDLIRRYRVVLVGRASETAARQLKQQGLKAELTINLENAEQIPLVMQKLKAHQPQYELVLVGASVPGRILCAKIKSKLNVTAIEIGHIMDALSNPKVWTEESKNRTWFKQRYLRNQSKNSE
ncbi:GT-D fold domain-containing glycosyltransferase [Paenibacillus alkaliterrae]|uniref:GT-D fold domain-containing protein n=1 Tax=Paenibacillus alkaliterrae TaxID=320909 RepID=UPI001F40AAAF|nr:GT-D fold domain-containing glycosyltransferase [Paenibacillus alkaliterrae]MCF2937100.1 GT-D fold domain-containing glycosyltransferase [Paenibacillus alkaliterrae]